MNPLFILLIFASYLLGSVPFGLIIAKAHGKDLRNIGSGNIGATNVSRALGPVWGYTCFGLDVFKGLLPMLLGMLIVSSPPTVAELWVWLCVGCAAIFGHVFPIYVKFKGGKGVATSLGVLLGLFPYYTFCGILSLFVCCMCILIWKYVSLGSILGAISLPLSMITLIIIRPDWELVNLWPLVIVALGMTSLVVLRHVENIKRLIEGSENKVMQKH
jgi:glycerol-3-phosphate acyltransferase PlsY